MAEVGKVTVPVRLVEQSERHEFHLVQGWLGYCTCGWVCDRPQYRLYAWRDIADSWRDHARWYRDNPEVSSLQ